MRKFAAVLCLVCLFAGAADCFRPALDRGVQEVSVRGFWDPDGALGSEFDISGSYGMFLIDNLLAGGLASYASYEDSVTGTSADTRIWMLGGFLEYHMDLGMLTVPYGGLEVGYASYKIAGGSSENAFIYGPKVGMKYFLSEKVAIDLALKYMLASDDIFLNKGEFESSDLFVTFGVRALF